MNSKSFADDMLERARKEAKIIESQRNEIMRHATKEAKSIYAQRDEILCAFIAKFGFDPDHAMQVTSGQNGQHTWQIVHFTDEDVAKIRRTLLIARISREPLSLWQKCCVWLANWKWPK